MTRSTVDDETATLKIGAVARLTGVSVHTLRKWQDRYAAVEPQRTEGGERVYTRTDLRRLSYIKRLSDAGMSLREIAKMTLDELEGAWEQTSGVQVANLGATVPDKIRIAILGDLLPILLDRRGGSSGRLQVIASGESEKALSEMLGDEPADILVYECPSVRGDTRERVSELLKNLSVRGAIVVYGFGARGHLAGLRQTNVSVMRAPVDLEELELIARGLLYGVAASQTRHHREDSLVSAGEIPTPRLSRDTIRRIASSSPKMRCECPHHLADIVLNLRAFEEYSEECENRNAEDAELHHFLWMSAAKARALFEDAIVRIAEVEGISLDD